MAYPYLKGKTWYIGYKDRHGRARQRATKAQTKTEARKMAEELERKEERISMGIEEAPPNQVLFEDVAQKYLDIHASKLRSYDDIEARLRLHVLPTFKGKYLAEIAPADIEALMGRKRRDGYSPQQTEHLRILMSGIFTFAIERLEVFKGVNPASKAERAELPEYKPKAIDLELVPLLIQGVPEKFRRMAMTGVCTGMRKGELIGQLVENVDLKNKVIYVRNSYDGPTKGSRSRAVAIPPELEPTIAAQLSESRSKYLFPADDGGMLPKHTDLAEMMRAAAKNAGLLLGFDHKCRRQTCRYSERRADEAPRQCPKCGSKLNCEGVPMEVVFKDLRSTYGTHAYQATGDIRFVQKQLGHENVKTTETHYAANDVEHLVKQAGKVSFGTYPALTAPQTDNSALPAYSVLPSETSARSTGLEPVTSGVTGRKGPVAVVGRASQSFGTVGGNENQRSAASGNFRQVSSSFAGAELTEQKTRQPPPDDGHRYVTLAEAGKLLGVGYRQVKKYCEAGKLKRYGQGFHAYLREEDVHAFLEHKRSPEKLGLVSAKEAGEILGVGIHRINQLCHEGKLNKVHIGFFAYFKREHVLELKAQRDSAGRAHK